MPERRRRHERAELELRRARRQAGDRRPRVDDVTVLVEPGEVMVGAEERLDAVFLAGRGKRDPVVPGHTLLALDHECKPHEAEDYVRPEPAACGRKVTLSARTPCAFWTV